MPSSVKLVVEASSPSPAAAQADLPDLMRIDIEVPFSVQIDLAPLVAAAAGAPEADGVWYGLREHFAYLGLARGFDELMCGELLTV
jgi:hypothetical protein